MLSGLGGQHKGLAAAPVALSLCAVSIIRELRERAGLTQTLLAKLSGVSTRTISESNPAAEVQR